MKSNISLVDSSVSCPVSRKGGRAPDRLRRQSSSSSSSKLATDGGNRRSRRSPHRKRIRTVAWKSHRLSHSFHCYDDGDHHSSTCPVESGSDALALAGGSSGLPAAFASCRCLSLSPCHVSAPRSPNPSCGFPATGSPVGSCRSLTGRSDTHGDGAAADAARVSGVARPRLLPARSRARCPSLSHAVVPLLSNIVPGS